MSRDIGLYIRDIIRNMKEAEEFVQGMSQAEFAADKKTFNAVLRSIEVIGEAAKYVPESIRQQNPDVPWREMAGMRDKVIHFYFGVHVETVWITVTERIPSLRPVIERILRERPLSSPDEDSRELPEQRNQ